MNPIKRRFCKGLVWAGLDAAAWNRPVLQRNHLKEAPAMAYDSNNIFARILRGEIPCDKVYEDSHVLAFRDIRPHAKVHVLLIPKGPYVSLEDFSARASEAEIVAFHRAIPKITAELGVAVTGYRAIANSGADSHQEVPHYHLHLLGGQRLGPLLSLPH
jgi:diadenosine tetraphosphate (Ap4A) HIT family hydrolase